jgi:hypothetical protein
MHLKRRQLNYLNVPLLFAVDDCLEVVSLLVDVTGCFCVEGIVVTEWSVVKLQRLSSVK